MRGPSGCRAPPGGGEGQALRGTRRHTKENRRGKGNGTPSSSERVNWGPSGRPRTAGINHKPADATRGADVAIVSNDPAGQYNRLGSQGPLGGCVVSEAMSTAGGNSHYGSTRLDEISTVAASKPLRQRRRARLKARLKPYWGKPTVRNFRGGGGNGSMV